MKQLMLIFGMIFNSNYSYSSIYYYEHGEFVGSKKYWEEGKYPGSSTYWETGIHAGSLKYWQDGLFPGSKTFWNNGTEIGSRYYWHNGKFEGSKQYWLHGDYSSIGRDEKGHPIFGFAPICLGMMEDQMSLPDVCVEIMDDL